MPRGNPSAHSTLSCRLAGLDLAEEAVDDPALAGFVVEALADDPTSEAGRERTDLGAQLRDGLLPLRLDLRLAVLDDAAGLGLGLLAHLRDDGGPLLAG